MKLITSRQNPEIKAAAALQQAKERKIKQQFLAEGVRTVETVMTKFRPIQLYMTQELFDQHILSSVDKNNITLVSLEVMDKLSTTKTPSGIVGVFAIPSAPNKPLTKGIVLANVTNPGNMGTLIRTAAAMGSKTVVVLDGVDPWHPKVIQATVGTIAHVDLFEYSWQELLEKKQQLKLCALVVKGGKPPDLLFDDNILMVIGNEATGIPTEWLAGCELSCTLTMPGNTESLNAAVAGSIALYLAFNTKSQ